MSCRRNSSLEEDTNHELHKDFDHLGGKFGNNGNFRKTWAFFIRN